jgi:hypothetical protein
LSVPMANAMARPGRKCTIGHSMDPSREIRSYCEAELRSKQKTSGLDAPSSSGRSAPPPRTRDRGVWFHPCLLRSGRREAREFSPASAHRDDYAALILWKSRKPAQTYIIDKRRVQAAFLLCDDIAYWRQRTDSEIEAQVKQTEARGRLLDLRKFVVEDKLCIAAALQKSEELGDSLILQMAGTLLAMIPVPGLKGDKIVQSLGELVSAVSAKLNE